MMDVTDTQEKITLRRYQQRVVEEFDDYLLRLRHEQEKIDDAYASLRAWDKVKELNLLKGVRLARDYNRMTTGDGRDLPNVCLLVPTGGGKTLLATQIIGSALKTLLPERSGSGLVLWLVPTQSIYDQTLVALRDPTHLYFRALKEATGSRIKVWEKEQIGGLQPLGLRRDLNILLLMLQSVSRKVPAEGEAEGGKKSDFLRYFRDGRVHPAHFPPETDEGAHRCLKHGCRAEAGQMGTGNLDTLSGSDLVRTSLANLVRLCRPIVIVDEQQKAATQTARETLAQLNPSLLVQLSATPKQTNVLVRVTGKELLQEQMIKLPIAVHTDGIGDWQRCLDAAHRKREELEQAAQNWQQSEGRYIRPIVVVQAERTGKDQVHDTNHIHSETVRKYLALNLGIPSDQIAVKTSDEDGLKGVDLLDPACPIRWIVTRDALREGWDCPFAYLLVSLLSSSSLAALTQLVGRVLRQPYQTKTGDDRLDRCYVFARHSQTDDTLKAVKKSLGDAGYESDEFIHIEKEGQDVAKKMIVEAHFRRELLLDYHPSLPAGATPGTSFPPIPATVLLPRFCVCADPETPSWKPLDWYSDLLPYIDDRKFDMTAVDEWRLGDELKRARDRYALLNIDQLIPELHDEAIPQEAVENDEATRAWLTVNVDLPHFSAKERGRLIDCVLNRLLARERFLVDKLALVRYALRDRITMLMEVESDRLTEIHFRNLKSQKRMGFTYVYEPCRYEVPEAIRRTASKRLRFDDQEPMQAAMDFNADEDFNGLERDFAYMADHDADISWWYRNINGEFGIQGWQRRRFYPDFVLQMRHGGKAAPIFLMVETKGAQLSENTDTKYKRAVAACFNEIGEAVPWLKMAGWENEDGSPVDHQFQLCILSQHERLETAWHDAWQRMKEDPVARLRPLVQSIAFIKTK